MCVPLPHPRPVLVLRLGGALGAMWCSGCWSKSRHPPRCGRQPLRPAFGSTKWASSWRAWASRPPCPRFGAVAPGLHEWHELECEMCPCVVLPQAWVEPPTMCVCVLALATAVCSSCCLLDLRQRATWMARTPSWAQCPTCSPRWWWGARSRPPCRTWWVHAKRSGMPCPHRCPLRPDAPCVRTLSSSSPPSPLSLSCLSCLSCWLCSDGGSGPLCVLHPSDQEGGCHRQQGRRGAIEVVQADPCVCVGSGGAWCRVLCWCTLGVV